MYILLADAGSTLDGHRTVSWFIGGAPLLERIVELAQLPVVN
jgi:hypothetical protein